MVTSGWVRTAPGSMVPDAAVTVMVADRDEMVDAAVTGLDGSWSFDLPPGCYVVTARADGYPAVHAVVDLRSADRRRVDLRLAST